MNYRGFDTYEDAKTFEDFLLEHGFNNVSIEKGKKLYKVYFKEKKE